ncbi:kinase-like domain-containing protein, partial [Gigaspora rosea]
IHRDLHSGNILQDSLNGARIADFGLLVTTSRSSNIGPNLVCGILPYIPPEVLNNQTYTTASDIYSFGIIMWEILFGIPITTLYNEKDNLQSQILFNGLRPPIFDLKSCYIDFMKKCWENDPKKRPSAVEICETFIKWQNDENIVLDLTENDKKGRKINDTDYSYNDQPFSYSKFLSQSITNNSKGESKILIIDFEEFSSIIKNSRN